ncbi:MAG: hypothetical protein CMI08_02655 [Oceanospirillaceae bacterium]|uniref:hypothetical protein n=1 Tax=unclassified Thalassolituus TaxID=2624967 RepID=UPI000C09D41F|nr:MULTISPECIES: hypothetical protein [unclassified Thalassolituus]MAK92151.1 hypothetical protein [Thalassolituus sp.]MAS24870.1 hypothetical protein [Oceanospirillaceae bacterium]MAX98099.1 hypothetical protein [Oceanospirillaceae bacterium]MBL33409.1 hypothetical protein [Oceanospirillaceae bacterium]MBS54331.1 hypothetical protein [Oceanospirillaceae bacterium]|tara:strand:- start:31 stop:282 length:252 start_codon:yes stop_codon:yes gene_type:complete
MNIGSTTGSAFTTAATAVTQGVDQVNRAAQDVVDATTARPVEGVGKTEKALTELKQGEVAVSAGAKVIEAADRQIGSLIDTSA